MPPRLAVPLALVAAVATTAFLWLGDWEGPARVAILAVAVVAHLVLVLAVRDRPGTKQALPPLLVLALTVGVVGGAMAAEPQGSDLWAYQMYGQIVTVHHTSPYRHPPQDFAPDPVLDRMGGTWVGNAAEYGPAMVGTAVVVSKATGSRPLATRLAWQGIGGLAVIAMVLLLWRRTGSAVAMAALGLNPLVVHQLVNGAHNDALIGLAVLGAVVLARDGRDVGAALLLAVAALIKAPLALALVAFVLWVAFRRGWRAAVAAGGAGAALGLVALALAGGRDVIEPMSLARTRTNRFTPWNLFRGGGATFRGNSLPDLPFLVSNRFATVALVTAAGVALAIALARAWRPTAAELAPDDHVAAKASARAAARPDPTAMLLGALLALTFLSLYTSPWSYGWVIPLAALQWRTWLARAVLVYVALVALVSQWGFVALVSLSHRSPAFAWQDNVDALGKSALTVLLLGTVAALLVDAARRVLRPPAAVSAGPVADPHAAELTPSIGR